MPRYQTGHSVSTTMFELSILELVDLLTNDNANKNKPFKKSRQL